jgi:Rrf2 family transcriptional regulator, iron-sulfur cluster assembly transcription factor
MIFSRSAEYAIRALALLGSHVGDGPVMAKELAAEGQIPPQFLAKILQDLAREGFLKSSKGPHGGFRLAYPAAEIPLMKVVEAVDGAGKYERCMAGHAECHERVACAMHESWSPVRARIVEYLQGTSVADLAKSLGEKRRLLARPRRSGAKR